MVEQFKVEDRRLSSARSPFSRIDKGILQTQTADLDAEFHAQERRIQELEVLAVDRQQEVTEALFKSFKFEKESLVCHTRLAVLLCKLEEFVSVRSVGNLNYISVQPHIKHANHGHYVYIS